VYVEKVLKMKSKYLEQFQKLEGLRDKFELVGDFMLIERMPQEEKKTKSGIVLAPTPGDYKSELQAEQPVFAHVLAVGEGFYDDETGEDIDGKAKPGDIILISPMCVTWFKTFGTVISEGDALVGVARENDAKMFFKGVEGYTAVFEALV